MNSNRINPITSINESNEQMRKSARHQGKGQANGDIKKA
jgi:hypothetical protein